MFRPDIEAASLGASGIPTPNADWTADARKYIQEAVVQNRAAKDAQVVPMPELTGDDAAYAAEYQSLYRAVSTAVMQHGFVFKLPSKKQADGKYAFDWTLGPGAKHLGELGGGNYGLFVYGYDAYATAGRKMMQIFILVATSAIGAGVLPSGGQHFSYASLVDLDSGKIVWFNFYANKKGDHADNPSGYIDRGHKHNIPQPHTAHKFVTFAPSPPPYYLERESQIPLEGRY